MCPTGERDALRGALCALLCAVFAFLHTHALAQSGRNRSNQPQGTTPGARQPANQRPRRAATQPSAGPARQTGPGGPTTAAPASSAPTDALPDDLPPPPQPTPTPAPATTANPTNAEDGGEEIGEEDIVRVTSNLVTVPASVVDAQGRAVTDLKVEDFELRVDGQPRPISEVSRAETPVQLVLLFDNSSSLSAAREFEKKAAVRFFRSVVRPVDRAAIVSISTVPSIEQHLTPDVSALVRTIERFGKPEGATALFDAVAQSAAYLRPLPGRKVLVIVSDGADTLSELDFNTTLRRVIAADCQVYAVQTGQIENANLRDLAAERRLQEFAAQTGGAVYVPYDTNDLDRAFAQISADLAQQYILSYYPQDDRHDGRFRTLSVRVKTRPNMRVRARKGYYDQAGQRQALAPTREGADAAFTSSSSDGGSSNAAANTGASITPAAVNTEAVSEQPAAARAGLSLSSGTNANSGLSRTSGGRGPSDDLEQPEAVAAAPTRLTPPAPPPASTGGATPQPRAESKPQPRANSQASDRQQLSAARESAPPPAKVAAPPSAEPRKPGVISGGVLNGRAINLPKPIYPPAARSVGASGTVVVEVTIGEGGEVIEARAVSGPPLLQQAAVEAARRAKFSPTTLSGRPVKVAGTISYRFSR